MNQIKTDYINHQNWCQFSYEEEFTFLVNGKYVYIKRSFENNQRLYWVANAEGYPLDQGTPSSSRVYAAVRRTKR